MIGFCFVDMELCPVERQVSVAGLAWVRFEAIYIENQHLRTVNVNGERDATLSLAHREFQDLKIALYRELADKGVDGIYVDLQRKPGVMGVDEPVARAFEQETGRRPEKKDFRTETWLRIRAGFVTDFMRRVRGALDEVGARQKRRIPIAIQGFAGRYAGAWPRPGMVARIAADIPALDGAEVQ